MKCKLLIPVAAAAIFLTTHADAGLSLNVDILTADEFKFTISGAFDADVIGDQTQWLAIKRDWTNNFGTNTPWIDDSVGSGILQNGPWTVVENSIMIGGVAPENSFYNSTNPWGDSIFFSNAGDAPILAGTTVSGSIHLQGVGLFDPSVPLTEFELLSGFDDIALDWSRLEAVVPAPGAFALLAVAGFAARRRRRN